MTTPPTQPPRPDDNARRLIILRRYLDGGMRLADAVEATNKFFRTEAHETEEAAA